jgi:hypothetical protein
MPSYRLRNAVKQLPILPPPDSGYPDLDTLKVVQKYGRNAAVTTALVPITTNGIYNTTTVLTALEVVSDDANDTAAGTGARTFEIMGLTTNWAEASETVSLNGTTAVAFTNEWYRVYRGKVLSSGSYATQNTASQFGTLTIQKSGGGAEWVQIDEVVAGFGAAQTQIGAYTVEDGKVAYVPHVLISVDSGKAASVYFFVREGADTVTAPFTPLQLKEQFDGIKGAFEFEPEAALGPYIGPCDLGFLGNVAATTASVTVDFTIYIFDLKDAS